MMLKNITHREWVDKYEYSHSFSWDDCPGAGFSFDCFENGAVDLGSYSEGAKENFWRAIFGLFDKPLTYKGITERDCSYWEPAYGTCVCGRRVFLEHDNGHGIDCDCGRIYNMSGQELAPRSQWEDRWDDDSTQPYCVEFGYEN